MPKLNVSAFLLELLEILIFTYPQQTMKIFYVFLLAFTIVSCDVIPAGNTIYRPYPSRPAGNSATVSENQEFRDLMEKDLINKKRVNAEVLTYLLNDGDPEEKSTATVIENASSCNIIVRVVGINNNQIYNLPVARHSKNQFIIKKGNYTLKSNICGAKYYAQKNILDALILKLSSN